MSFEQLKVAAPILKALAEEGYTDPTPIQQQAIPVVLQERDILGCARTGTGKTAAFAIPVIQLLAEEKKTAPKPGIRALVLTPTRELALQIQESFDTYGKYAGLRQVVIFGGVSQQAQVTELRRGADILVATPGRLLDLMQQGIINISQIRILVLDEADRMLDMGFIHDVKKVISKTPAQKQTLFFSATMAPEIKKLSDTILKNPAYVEVTPVASTAETVEQSLYFVDKKNKNPLLVHIFKDPAISASIVFSRTKHGANKIAKALNNAGIPAEAIHGNKSQSARQRALQLLKEREIRALVATDIAARGIDVEELSHVINYDLPNIPETYVHRIGRTGRAGANGLAISFCDQEEKEFLRDIQKLIKKTVPVINDHPYPFGSPIAKEPVAQTSNRPQQQGNRNAAGNGRNQQKQESRPARNNGGQQQQNNRQQQGSNRQQASAQQANRTGQQPSQQPNRNKQPQGSAPVLVKHTPSLKGQQPVQNNQQPKQAPPFVKHAQQPKQQAGNVQQAGNPQQQRPVQQPGNAIQQKPQQKVVQPQPVKPAQQQGKGIYQNPANKNQQQAATDQKKIHNNNSKPGQVTQQPKQYIPQEKKENFVSQIPAKRYDEFNEEAERW